MPNVATISQMDFVDRIFATAKRLRVETGLNRNGDRQMTFENKSLTEEHVRRIYQDIVRKKYVYRRRDMDVLLAGSRPCAIAPFLNLCIEAGLASDSEENGEILYKFEF